MNIILQSTITCPECGHKKEEASPLVPANRAKTGVMQHSDAEIAVKSPSPASLLSDFIFLLSMSLVVVF